MSFWLIFWVSKNQMESWEKLIISSVSLELELPRYIDGNALMMKGGSRVSIITRKIQIISQLSS